MRIFLLPAFAPWIAPCRHVLTTPLGPTGTTTAIGRTRGRRIVLFGEQTGNAACPPLLGARTWSVALPGTGATARPKEEEALRQSAAPILESRTLTRFGPESAGKPCHRPKACGMRTGSLWLLRRPLFLAENFCMVTQNGCAVLLDKDTFEPCNMCVPLFEDAADEFGLGERVTPPPSLLPPPLPKLKPPRKKNLKK